MSDSHMMTNSYYVYQATLTNLQPGATCSYAVQLAGRQTLPRLTEARPGTRVCDPQQHG